VLDDPYNSSACAHGPSNFIEPKLFTSWVQISHAWLMPSVLELVMKLLVCTGRRFLTQAESRCEDTPGPESTRASRSTEKTHEYVHRLHLSQLHTLASISGDRSNARMSWTPLSLKNGIKQPVPVPTSRILLLGPKSGTASTICAILCSAQASASVAKLFSGVVVQGKDGRWTCLPA
jgi:hypothetical protein